MTTIGSGRALVAAALALAACATPAETIERTLRVGARERSYEIDLPPQRQSARAFPVVSSSTAAAARPTRCAGRAG